MPGFSILKNTLNVDSLDDSSWDRITILQTMGQKNEPTSVRTVVWSFVITAVIEFSMAEKNAIYLNCFHQLLHSTWKRNQKDHEHFNKDRIQVFPNTQNSNRYEDLCSFWLFGEFRKIGAFLVLHLCLSWAELPIKNQEICCELHRILLSSDHFLWSFSRPHTVIWFGPWYWIKDTEGCIQS